MLSFARFVSDEEADAIVNASNALFHASDLYNKADRGGYVQSSVRTSTTA